MKGYYTYVSEVVQANLAALERGQGIYNIGTGVPRDTMTLWEAVKKMAGKDVPNHIGPVRAGDIRYRAMY